MIVPGTLYLLPCSLGLPGGNEALHSVIPSEVCAITSRLGYLIAENAKTARAHLNSISRTHPLAMLIQEIKIMELNVNTDASALQSMLAPLMSGQDAGLISEAGVPAVADPGANLVRLAHRHHIPVKPLVGPSSLLLALMASGLNGQSFAFHGYLPIDAAKRSKRIKQLEERSRLERQTQLFIETPYRNQALIEALTKVCHPQTLVCAATDLTLASESVVTRTAAEWKKHVDQNNAPDLQKRPTVFLMLAA